jgi:hypothetical protein
MSKTNRNQPFWKRYWHRNPKTTNEIKQNLALFNDLKNNDVEYRISGINRFHRHIPTAYDDILVSSYAEKINPMIPIEFTEQELFILQNALNYYNDFIEKHKSNSVEISVKVIQSKISNQLKKPNGTN